PLDESSKVPKLFSLTNPKSLFSRAALRAGLKSHLIKRSLLDISKLQLPLILILKNNYCCILDDIDENRNRAKILYPDDEDGLAEWVDLDKVEGDYLGFAFMLKKVYKYDEKSSRFKYFQQKHWFWDTIKLSKRTFLDAILASFMINIFVLAMPLFTMNVYDRVIPNNAKETLFVFTIGIVIVYFLDFLLKSLRAYFLELSAKKSDIIISSLIFEKILDLKMMSHLKSVGSFVNNIKDFEFLRSFFSSLTLVTIIDFPFSIIFLYMIYYIGGSLVFVPIITIFIILIYAVIIRIPLKKSIESMHEVNAKRNGILIETLQNIETIKTQRLASKKQWMWEETTGEISKKNLKSKILASSIPNVTHLFIQLNTVFVIFFGVYLIEDSLLTLGGLIAVVILTSRAVAPIGQVATLILNYTDAKASYDVIDDILSNDAESLNEKNFIRREKIFGHIEFRDVTFTYPNGDLPALKNVSFKIEAGEKVGIIGRIGSGKSTISKLILKLYEPDSGTILLDGIDISQIDPTDIRKNIGYLSQDVSLFNGTIRDNIISSKTNMDDEELMRIAKISGIDRFLNIHPRGYDMLIADRGYGLSGGQKQGMGIARALMNSSTMLLLDEPTNGMDNTSERELIDNLKTEIEDMTFMLVTQKMSVLELCDRIIVMHNGNLMMDGFKDEVIKKLG
ncbi:MAG: type I secretion system permease/ATPase, partial [Campylobacterales bacterium]|nr:type I secretion system permease/ATPase [Campylobacterales bacterium]